MKQPHKSDSIHHIADVSDLAATSDSDDSPLTILQKGSKRTLKSTVITSTSDSSHDEGADIQTQILQQLQCMNKRLEEVEQKVDKSRSSQWKKGKDCDKLSKSCLHSKKGGAKISDRDISLSDDEELPDIGHLRSSKVIQTQYTDI